MLTLTSEILPNVKSVEKKEKGNGKTLASWVECQHSLVTLISVTTCYVISLSAAAKLLQSCRTLCDPIDGSPPGSPVPGILQARTLEWVAISFSNQPICCQVTLVVSYSMRPHRRQPTRLPHPWDSPGKNTGVACHFLLHQPMQGISYVSTTHQLTIQDLNKVVVKIVFRLFLEMKVNGNNFLLRKNRIMYVF